MRLSLHVGPGRTGSTWVREAAAANAQLLARHGVHALEAAAVVKAAKALNQMRPDIASRAMLAAAEAATAGGDSGLLLGSSEAFFAASLEDAPRYERAFGEFAATLAAAGLALEVVFVERDLEDLITSHALHEACLGNLEFVTPDAAPYARFIERYRWLKAFYFGRFPVLHLSFDHLTGEGDVFANFLRLAYGLEVGKLLPAADARNACSDAAIARGLVMAPMVNWLEQFGSLPRQQLLEGPGPLEAQVTGASWDAMVANVALLRDSARANAKRALLRFVENRETQPA